MAQIDPNNSFDPNMDAMPPDPIQLQGGLEQQQTQDLQRMAPAMQNRALMLGGASAARMDPRVAQAMQQQAQIKSVLASVQQDAPENEDPLDYQARLSTQILSTMGQSNPKLAMQASQRLVAIQEAKSQRKLIGTKIAEAQATTSETLEKLKEGQYNFAAGKLMPKVMYQMPPPNPNGTRGGGAPIPITLTDENGDPRTDHDKLAQEFKAAQATYPGGDLMTGDQLNNARAQAAQYGLQRAQIEAAARVQAAMIGAAARNNALSGRDAMMTNRILSSTELGSTALQNISEMTFGANAGWMGIGKAPGESVVDAVRDNLRNKLSDNEVQAYQSAATGLERNLAMVEMQGGMQGGQKFSDQIHTALALRPSDTPETIMSKLAEARQILEVGSRVYLANPKLDPEVKAQVEQSVDRLRAAVPWTQHDLTTFRAAQDKNPQLTYRQWAASHNIGNAANTPAPQMTPADIEAARTRANAAIANKRDKDKVAAQFKQLTGQDL